MAVDSEVSNQDSKAWYQGVGVSDSNRRKKSACHPFAQRTEPEPWTGGERERSPPRRHSLITVTLPGKGGASQSK